MGMRAALEFIRTERAEAGVDDPIDLGTFTEPIHIGEPTWDVGEYTATGSPDAIAERMARYRKMGVAHLQVRFPSRSCDEFVEQITRFGTEVWPQVAA
jgi:alkanesulfonate monooxygenase SsuD/methylene tetrahydromethanopterin reductase-like flavin-dependent oxidoreductase (luciferase family)